VSNILRNPALAGYVVHKTEIHEHDDTGQPMMATEYPVLTHAEWTETAKALDSRNTRAKKTDIRHRLSAGVHTGIAWCRGCSQGLYKHVTPKTMANGEIRIYAYYMCSGKLAGVKCEGKVSVRAAELEEAFEDYLLETVGHLPEVTRIWDEGEDHTEELDRYRSRRERLKRDYKEGKYDSPAKEALYWEIVEEITAKITELEKLPSRAARYRYEETGRTIAEKWAAMSIPEKREFQIRSGVRIIVWRTGQDGMTSGYLMDLGDLKQLARAAGALPNDLDAPDQREQRLENVSKEQFFALVKSGMLTLPQRRLRA
jgi:hypothetical protein